MECIRANASNSRFLFLKKEEELEEDFLNSVRIITIYPQEDRDIIEYVTKEDDTLLRNNRNFSDLRDKLERVIKSLEGEVEILLREEDTTVTRLLDPYEIIEETKVEKEERQKKVRIKRLAKEQVLHSLRKVLEGYNGD